MFAAGGTICRCDVKVGVEIVNVRSESFGGWIDVRNIGEITKLNMVSWISLGLRRLFTVLA
jgi:hypothetical protein